MLSVLREEAEGAISNSEIVVRNRIDRFGVAQPIVQRLERSGRILVELPGVKDPERVRKLLQGTASLEFWETYDNSEVYGALFAVNNRLAELRQLENPEENVTPAAEIQAQESVPAQLNEAAPDTLQNNTQEVQATATDSLKAQDSTNADILSQLKEGEGQNADSAAMQAIDRAEYAKKNPLFALLTPSVTQQG